MTYGLVQRLIRDVWLLLNTYLMPQKSMSMDSISLEKTIKGFKIAGLGALLSGLVLLSPEIADFLASGDVINWRPAASAAWGSFATGVINMIREYVKGQ